MITYLFFVIFMFPYFYMILSSFKTPLQLMAYPPTWIFQPTWENYLRVIFDKNFFLYAKNSAVVAVVNTVLAFVIAIPAAYGLAKTSSRHKGQITYLVLFCQMIPPIAVVISFFIIAQTLGLIDTLSSLIIFELLWTIPLAVWLLRGYFINFPAALTESAQVDGASLFQAVRQDRRAHGRPGNPGHFDLCFYSGLERFRFGLFHHGDESADPPDHDRLLPGIYADRMGFNVCRSHPYDLADRHFRDPKPALLRSRRKYGGDKGIITQRAKSIGHRRKEEILLYFLPALAAYALEFHPRTLVFRYVSFGV